MFWPRYITAPGITREPGVCGTPFVRIHRRKEKQCAGKIGSQDCDALGYFTKRLDPHSARQALLSLIRCAKRIKSTLIAAPHVRVFEISDMAAVPCLPLCLMFGYTAIS